jgi:RNA polymerase sigma-70 factor (ECF subfamily)
MKFQDRYLIYQTRRGKPEAFAKLYDKYLDKIYRFIFFRVPSQEQAEDLCSQVFLKVLEYINSGRKIENFQALLYQTARNLIIDSYRQKGKEILLEDFSQGINLSLEESLEEQIDRELDLKEIEKALKKLHPGYQEIIILHYLEELSIKEIAEILEKNKGAVRVLIHRALKALKKELLE